MQEIKQEKSPIKQRILQYLGRKGISMYDCYSKTGITRGVLGQNNGISEENLSKFLAYYTEITTEWLVLGIGSMLRSNEKTKVEQYVSQNNIASNDESIIYKLYKEKDIEVGQLKEEIGVLKTRIQQLEAYNESLRNQAGADRVTDTFTNLPLVDYEEDCPPVERPSSSKHPLAGKA